MFIIAQIPFVDFRLLSSKKYKEYEDCFFPNTFDKRFDRALYYRFLGQEKNRFSPNGLPLSERRFFDSRKILRLSRQDVQGDDSYFPKLIFSRFFEDTQCFHFDIGLREMIKEREHPHNLNQFAKNFMQTPLFCINDHYEREDKSYNLLGLAQKVKEIYLYATTSKRAEQHNGYSPQVVLGAPALFITYDKRESHSFGNAEEVQLENGIKARHELVSVKNHFVDVWYIGKDRLSKHDQDLRNLRIYLSKLHSYKESTRIILDYMDKNGEYGLDIQKTGAFLSLMLKQMCREQYYGYRNDDFWEAAFYVDHEYNHVSWDSFKRRIEAKLEAISMSAGGVTIKDSIVNTGFMKDTQAILHKGDGELNLSVGASCEPLEQCVQQFDAVINEVTESSRQLTEEQKKLIKDNAEAYETYVRGKAPDKSFADRLFENVKNMLTFAVVNSEGIQRLTEIGKKIIDLL